MIVELKLGTGTLEVDKNKLHIFYFMKKKLNKNGLRSKIIGKSDLADPKLTPVFDLEDHKTK